MNKHRLAILLLSQLITACHSEQHNLEQYLRQIKSRPAEKVVFEPLLQPLVANSMQTLSRTELFKAVERALDPQRKLRFVGSLGDFSVTWALIRQEDGLIHRVKTGDFLQGLRVLEVKKDRVQLEMVDAKKSIELCLGSVEEGKRLEIDIA